MHFANIHFANIHFANMAALLRLPFSLLRCLAWPTANKEVKDDGKWHRRVKLPLPIQQQCPEKEEDAKR